MKYTPGTKVKRDKNMIDFAIEMASKAHRANEIGDKVWERFNRGKKKQDFISPLQISG